MTEPNSAPPFMLGQFLYRATSTMGVYICYTKYLVIKVTPQGARVGPCPFDFANPEDQHTFWVSHTTRRVARTKEEALEQLKRRTEAWIRFERRRLNLALHKAKNLGLSVELPLLSMSRTHSHFPLE